MLLSEWIVDVYCFQETKNNKDVKGTAKKLWLVDG